MTSVVTRSGDRGAQRALRRLRAAAREVLTTLHAAAVLAVVELLIRWVPLPRLSRLLGVRVSLDPKPVELRPLPPAALAPQARRQARCARRVADAWPLSPGPCLRRSLVLGHLLRRHDPAVRLGLKGAGDSLVAHAWVEIDDRPLEDVTGFKTFQQPSDPSP